MSHGRLRLLAIAALLPLTAMATPIVIDPIPGGDSGGTLGGYALTDFANPDPTDSNNPADDYHCVASPISGQLCFEDKHGNPEGMDASDPAWWEWDGTPGPDHQNVYTTDISWIELILPENTRAFSFWVGASFSGRAWIQAFDRDNGFSTQRVHFGIGPDNTSGYGVYSSDGCSAISRVIVEPDNWGVGNFSINQDPCVQIPEPAPAGLIVLGLLVMAAGRKFRALKTR